ENFNSGRLMTGKSRSPEGETFVYDASSQYPIPEGGFEEFNAYVKSETRKIDDEFGHVKISFRVTREAALADVVIVQGASLTLDAKAKEILLRGPRWLPARNHGYEPVDAEGFVQIEFY
ncbi:MAG TPA: hypothetical protein VFO54_01520, partial [Chryseosolibacter sp.]|nr:hypothetical protein [Chryseosolibacter sp.]